MASFGQFRAVLGSFGQCLARNLRHSARKPTLMRMPGAFGAPGACLVQLMLFLCYCFGISGMLWNFPFLCSRIAHSYTRTTEFVVRGSRGRMFTSYYNELPPGLINCTILKTITDIYDLEMPFISSFFLCYW